MQAALKGAAVLLFATFCAVGESGAQTEQQPVAAPEMMQPAPASETRQFVPGIIVTPPAPLPPQTQPNTCPDTGQKLELIG